VEGSEGERTMSENKNVVETHGCIVCAKVFNILAVYTPEGRLVDCTVTSPGGQIVSDKQQPLVACNTHTAGEIEAAYNRWQSKKSTKSDQEDEEE
jgi:hypothetical protein